ncbi:hypothetical protein PsorP6_004075 [Peronosclerospora sorghi]|uniref:Uncharacterized protein n=1 Tax=Peronosclerospora sorghi TaxID=230839 RepID=A0ACC0VPG6_9STRA|nr:hypothetical protein PsorP6_004075 [Peronosclerospora sorghi]
MIAAREEAKSVTFVTKRITMDLLDEMKSKKLKVLFARLKLFERNEAPEGGKIYRLCQTGLPHFVPFMNKRKTKVSAKDFQILLDRRGDLLNFIDFEPPTQQYFEEASISSVNKDLRLGHNMKDSQHETQLCERNECSMVPEICANCDKRRLKEDQMRRLKRRCTKFDRMLQAKEAEILSMQDETQHLQFPLLMHETMRNLHSM